jgi:hypothetical protein
VLVFEKWTTYVRPRLASLSQTDREAFIQAAADALNRAIAGLRSNMNQRLRTGSGLASGAIDSARRSFEDIASREKQHLMAELSLYMTTPPTPAGTNINVVTSGANSPVNVGPGTLSQRIGGQASMQDLAAALGSLIELIDRHHSDDARELREVVAEAKAEAEKSAPNRLRLKSILAGCRDAVQTFAALDPGWQGVQAIAHMLGF